MTAFQKVIFVNANRSEMSKRNCLLTSVKLVTVITCSLFITCQTFLLNTHTQSMIATILKQIFSKRLTQILGDWSRWSSRPILCLRSRFGNISPTGKFTITLYLAVMACNHTKSAHARINSFIWCLNVFRLKCFWWTHPWVLFIDMTTWCVFYVYL